jgi:hypothetical protein
MRCSEKTTAKGGRCSDSQTGMKMMMLMLMLMLMLMADAGREWKTVPAMGWVREQGGWKSAG